MDTYLDPSLGGPLVFLDSSTQLHAPSDPSSQPLNAFDYDSWLNPVSAPSYDGTQGLTSTHGTPTSATLGLDGRGPISSAHFGVPLHPEPRANPKTSSAPLSPLSPATHATGPMHLAFNAADYSDGMFHARPNLAAQAFGHPSPSSAHPEAGTESMSIAMYDRQIGNPALAATGTAGTARHAIGDYAASLRDSSGTTTSPATSRPTLSAAAPIVQHRPPTGSEPQSRSANTMHSQHSPARGLYGNSPSTARSKGSRAPQADESVPEAALHLLRLALPAGSTGSAATNTTGDGDRSDNEDVEGESDDTSIHSTDLKALTNLFPDTNAQPSLFDTTVWNHSEGQPPLHIQRGGGPGSRRPSAASSATSARVRQHNPARAQREASVASNRSRLGSEAPSHSTTGPGSASLSRVGMNGPAAAVGRRNTARGRKVTDEDGVSDNGENGGDYQEGDAYEEAEGPDGVKGKKKKPAKGTPAKGKGKATKRDSTASENPAPAKRARTSNAGSVPPSGAPRKPRRQAYIPPNLRNRTFPPEVEINASFPRFYRSFPVSSAIPPESYVLQPSMGSNAKIVGPPQALPAPHTHSLDVLPTPPTPIYEQFSFPHSPYAGHSPPIPSTSSTSSASLPNISVDSHGAFVLHDAPHAQSHAHYAPYSQNAYAIPPHTPSAHGMSPPPLPQHSPAPSQASQGSMASLTSSLSGISLMAPPPDARWNKAGDPLNLYYPRFVRGTAEDKSGLCPICAEPPERGGEGDQKWLKLKNSSYVYHMSYSHGLSNVTGLPFSPPVEMRIVDLPHQSKDTRTQMTEGRCHKCDEWIPLLSVKNIDAIVPELIWWKHAKKCHSDSTIPGERDPYIADEFYNLIISRKQDATF
ncbi:uncharacterized protein JCM15063_003498 [Sporobolomyces koalae]|uniref:uncharacterized protein n=1 Tax=Sporobolomyces koalae TaxID=500713 RepID=UPI003173AE46